MNFKRIYKVCYYTLCLPTILLFIAARQGDHTCSQITNLAMSWLNCAEGFSQRIRDFAPSPYQLRVQAHLS